MMVDIIMVGTQGNELHRSEDCSSVDCVGGWDSMRCGEGLDVI